MRFDLLLTGGDVVDPGGGHNGRLDVGVRAGRIEQIAPRLPHGEAAEVADVTGKLVTPGLVDLHTHTRGGYWGIDPDAYAWHTGVTTWVDAGTAGAYTWREMDHRVRSPALLNISTIGLAGQTGESRDLAACDVDAAVATVRAHRTQIAGVKARMDRGATGENGLEPLRRALAVADAGDLPVMVHIGAAPPPVDEVLALLRPGDIVTHCASGNAHRPPVVSPAVRAAHERGVLFDIGHGAGSFSFAVLEAFLEAGIVPHTVSTDLHARCVNGPVFDLPTTMAKMLAVGLDLPAVVAMATINPAEALSLTSGTLAIGAPADIAVFTAVAEPFEVFDAHLVPRVAPTRLLNTATYLNGSLLLPSFLDSPPWIALTTAQRAALTARAAAIREMLTRPLVDLDGLTEQFPPTTQEP
jgi:dihydroorotase